VLIGRAHHRNGLKEAQSKHHMPLVEAAHFDVGLCPGHSLFVMWWLRCCTGGRLGCRTDLLALPQWPFGPRTSAGQHTPASLSVHARTQAATAQPHAAPHRSISGAANALNAGLLVAVALPALALGWAVASSPLPWSGSPAVTWEGTTWADLADPEW
jgi:hypothetical protein